MSNILIVAEHAEGKIKKYSLELACKGAELANKTGGKAVALVIGGIAKDVAAEFGEYGIKKVVIAENPSLKFYSAESYSKVVSEAVTFEKASIVIGSASPLGKDLLPSVAAKLGVGFAQDCVSLDVEGSKLKVRRPVFAGKALMDFVFQSSPQVATARPNSFPIAKSGSSAPEIILLASDGGAIRAKVKEIKQVEKGETDVAEADIIVSGGRAVGNPENFKIIYDLAHVLHGSVGASRAAVDAGFISHDHQVGQTGKTVNPKLYIACGISGAIQHLAGMRTSHVIVAINKDAEAPIFTKADFGIVGDLFKIVPLLTEKLKKAIQE
ncbi:MAG: electron transfer flavoprotein subunit alpha/FixB family protein [Deltaproteobacteria bacterium]|nr:electron transfer flavoprotein subunit alpha/FixB family protein [Deltaproteobacteria bacterium]MBI2341752.1 electron transfer flavoprotein subunit alpha/FixB family protein [Deltaproteobacteria bacterium]